MWRNASRIPILLYHCGAMPGKFLTLLFKCPTLNDSYFYHPTTFLNTRSSGKTRKLKMKNPFSVFQKNKFPNRRSVLIVLIVLLELNGVFFISSRLFIQKSARTVQQQLLEVDKETLKSSVDNIIRDIGITKIHLQQQGKSEYEISNMLFWELYEKVHRYEYSKGRYIWVNEIINYGGGDNYAMRLIHPNPTSSEGMMLSTKTKDAAGNTPYQEELDLINKSGGGFYSYYYQPDADSDPVIRISYCALYKDYNWVICEGEDISSIRENESSIQKDLRPFLLYTDLILSVVGALITGITAWIFTRNYTKDLARRNEELNEAVFTDSLTGILNRTGLIAEFDRFLHDRIYKEMTGIYLDIDDFKLINDIYGHNAGDAALRHLAGFLRDAFPGALVGRNGGDEFCVILCDPSPEVRAKQIEKAFSGVKSFLYDGRHITYTISGGYADYPSQAVTREEMMTVMDHALYAAKMDGKHTARQYSPAMKNIKRDRLGFSFRNMTAGISGGVLVYQEENEKILFANDYLISLFECENFDDFLNYTHSTFRNVVYKEDLDEVERSIRSQIDQAKISPDSSMIRLEDYVEYRILTKSGKLREVIDFGSLVHDQHYGNIFYVFIQEKKKQNAD